MASSGRKDSASDLSPKQNADSSKTQTKSGFQPLLAENLTKQSMTIKELQGYVKKINHNVNQLIAIQPSIDFKNLISKNNETISANSSFMADFEKKWGEFSADISHKVSSIQNLVDENLVKINDALARLTAVEASAGINTCVIDRIGRLEDSAESAIRSQRRNDVIVSNVVGFKEAKISPMELIHRISSSLGVSISESDIAFIRILNSDRIGTDLVAPTQSHRYTDILVKFRDFSCKSRLMKAYFASKNLKNSDIGLSPIRSRIYLNDNLTVSNSKIFKEAKKLFKIQHNSPNNQKLIRSIYIYNGLIYIKDLNDIVHHMTSIEYVKSFHDHLTNSLPNPNA